MQLDAGAVLRKESGRDEPKIMRFLIGNPLIMKEMAKHIVNAASYAPVTVLAYEQSDGVHLSYDTMASLLAPYTNAEALTIACNLDSKIETLIREAAGSRQNEPNRYDELCAEDAFIVDLIRQNVIV